MTERDDRLPAAKHCRRQQGPDQGIGAFGATIQAHNPRHAILGPRCDRTRARTGSLSL
jgi:hypothetical protein